MSFQIIYGIAYAEELTPSELPDIDGLTLSIAQHGDLVAVISPTDKKRARPSRANIREHNLVNEELLKRVQSLLPMRFGIIADDTDAVITSILEPHANLFMEKLATVRKHVEFSVKVTWPDETLMEAVREHAPELTTVDVESLDLNARIELGKQVEAVAQSIHDMVATDTLTALESVAKDVVQNDPRNGSTSLDVSLLIERQQETVLEDVLNQVSDRLPSVLIIKMVGPMPVYSFADIEINLTDS